MGDAKYKKACACEGTSTTRVIRVTRRFNRRKGTISTSRRFIRGPSCDKCGKAWRTE